MSDLWLAGDPALSQSGLHLSIDQFLDEALAKKRELFQANGSSWICKFFQKHQCMRGQECPYRHSRGDKPYVCKYWLRGACKKGADTCESLHIYDLSKMPYCQFVIDYGTCSNADCLFNHVKPEVEEVDCLWYARGFCKHGPKCKNRHRKKEMCPDYLAGFCELGPQCEKGHPKWLLPEDNEVMAPQYDAAGRIIPGSELPRARTLRSLVGMSMTVPKGPKSMSEVQCNSCHQFGHMAGACPNAVRDPSGNATGHRQPRDLATVLCFRCGEHGHYATFCTNARREPPPEGWPLPAGAKPHAPRRDLKRGRPDQGYM